MMRALSLVALFLAGCSTLPDHPDTCGNGVIDRGEDCDNADRSRCDDQCRLLCPGGYDSECADGGTSYKCGADLICHAPSGVFREVPSTRFNYAVGQGSIADIDGDKIGDVVGFSDVNIDARFGDPQATMATRSAVILPFASPNISLRRRPGNPGDEAGGIPQTPDTSDALLPTPDGIAGFTARNKTLVSYPFASSPGERGACATVVVNGVDTAEPRASFSIDKHHLAFISRYKATALKGGLVLSVMDPETPSLCKHVDLCATTAPQNPSDAQIWFDHYETPNALAGQVSSVIVVASAQDPKAAVTQDACVVRFSGDRTTYQYSTATSLTVGNGPLALARGSDTPCPALYATHTNPLDDIGVDYYAPTVAPCQIQASSSGSFLGRGNLPVGHVPLVPAPMGSSNIYEPDLLATIAVSGLGGQTTLSRLAGGVPAGKPVFTEARPMNVIRFADIDGDGVVEGIGAVGPLVGGGQPDIEVLYRTQPASSTVSFVAYGIATSSAPTFVELGDFDGNSITDIAYTERLSGQERLMISYGTRDRPLDPVQIATFTHVGTLSRIDIKDSIESTGNVLDDLLVIDLIPVSPTAMSPQVEILHGNPQRSMLAYYDPRVAASLTRSSEFVGAIAGDFLVDNPVSDLVSFERMAIPPAAGSGLTDKFIIWTSPGSPYSAGFLDPQPSPIETTVISLGSCPDAATLCFTGTQLFPWKLSTGRAVIIAADAPAFTPGSTRARYTVTIDPQNTADPLHANQAVALPSNQPAVSMWQGDIAGDGKQRLVIALPVLPEFGFSDPTAVDEVRVCDVDDSGHVTACPKLSELVDDLHGYNCGAAETGRIGDGSRFKGGTLGPQGLLALCTTASRSESAIFHVTPVNGKLVATKVISNVPSYEFMSVGDLNGDSVDDAVGIGFDPVSHLPVISVHLQCDSHDTACIDENTDPLAQAAAP